MTGLLGAPVSVAHPWLLAGCVFLLGLATGLAVRDLQAGRRAAHARRARDRAERERNRYDRW